jgi:hypothetical protein
MEGAFCVLDANGGLGQTPLARNLASCSDHSDQSTGWLSRYDILTRFVRHDIITDGPRYDILT